MLESTLLKTVRAARKAPFYKNHLPKPRARFDLGWWRGLPLTTKDDLRDAYPFGLLATDRARIATYHESSGTTGTPTASPSIIRTKWRLAGYPGSAIST